MDLSSCNTNYPPMIQCSHCAMDVERHVMSTHTCPAVFPSVTAALNNPYYSPSGQSPNYASQMHEPLLHTHRPVLPRLAPHAANRPGIYSAETTPAISGHNLFAASPMSDSSGKRSPRHPPPSRRGSMAISRVPSSPEHTNLDCAFPPFPISSTRSTTPVRDDRLQRPYRERNNTQASEKSTNRSATSSSRSSAQPGSAVAQRRPGSSGSMQQRPRMSSADVRTTRPSTSGGSRRPSTSSRDGSREPSIDSLGPLRPTLAPRSSSHQSYDSRESTRGYPSPLVDVHPLSRVESNSFNDPGSYNMRSLDTVPESGMGVLPGQGENRHDAMATGATTRVREPSYKAKRPPPIISDPAAADDASSSRFKLRSPASPFPTSAARIGRSITGMFGRRRSQSAATTRPPAQRTNTDVTRNPASDFSALDDAHLMLTVPSSSVHQSDDGSPGQAANFEGFIFSPEFVASPTEEIASTESPHENLDYESSGPFAYLGTSKMRPESPEPHEDIGLRRSSIDSASSYESDGFSNHSLSSKSSSPPSHESSHQPDNARYRGSSIGANTPDDAQVPPSRQLEGLEVLDDSVAQAHFGLGIYAPALSASDAFLRPLPGQHSSTPSPVDHNILDSFPSVPAAEHKGSGVSIGDAKAVSRPSEPRSAHVSNKGSNKGTCRGCSQTIAAWQKSVSSADGRLTGRYHKECFACQTCKSPFATADFYVHEDQPYCGQHYHEVNGTLCASCGKGIEGRYLETSTAARHGSKKFHSECLSCTTCRVPLREDYFEFNDRVYCEKDAFRLANLPSRHPYDSAPSRPSPLVREYISSNGQGLQGRFPERRTTRIMMARPT